MARTSTRLVTLAGNATQAYTLPCGSGGVQVLPFPASLLIRLRFSGGEESASQPADTLSGNVLLFGEDVEWLVLEDTSGLLRKYTITIKED